MPNLFLFDLLLSPGQILRDLARRDSPTIEKLGKWLVFLLLIPPVASAVGGVTFGWRFGTSEPLVLTTAQGITISFLYYVAMCIGYFGTVLLARWMGRTYGAEITLDQYLAFFTVVIAPLCVASMAHLFPHIFFNVLVLIPAMIWSMLLMYRGMPVVLDIPSERGMLMSSVLVGWLLVAAVSLLGLSVGLWTIGLGPAIRV
jgi:hypothetical protein